MPGQAFSLSTHPNGPEWVKSGAKRGTLYTYSGAIAYPDGAPTLLDIAVGLSREGRYAGAGIRWWPVVLHTFVVCDLLPDKLKIHGLLHDSPECITGDTPKPVKTDEIERFEEELLGVIYKSLGLPLPSGTPVCGDSPATGEYADIKAADRLTMRGEVFTVGTQALQKVYQRCPETETLVMKYLAEYPPMECLAPDGRAVIEFLRRYRVYSDMFNIGEAYQKPGA